MFGNLVGKSFIFTSAIISATSAFLIFALITYYSKDAIMMNNWSLLTTTWNPAANQFGILPMLFGSIAVTLLALLFALPLGIASAIYTSELLNPRYRLLVKSLLELLAGIPSILYGLIGVTLVSVLIGELFNLSSGRTIFTAGLLLAIMILPTIVTLTDDALFAIPQKYRDTSKGLGFYSYQVIISTLLPIAKIDIYAAALLALGRALGETMAVMLVIGSIDRLPDPLFNLLVPGQTITSKLGREIEEAAFGSLHFSSLMLMTLVLLFLVVLLILLAQYFLKVDSRLHE